MTELLELDQTAASYDCLAPHYDDFTAGYAHEAWVEAIGLRARSLGLRGHRALDLACGTGKSTAPLIERGYSVLGCDISSGMISEARRKLPAYADCFFVADMRELPALGQFDLVLCVDDALNYLLTDEQLEATFEGVADLLTPEGMFVFDMNSLGTYRTTFTTAIVRETDRLFFTWRGEAHAAPPTAGEIAAATVEVFADIGDGMWERHTSRHVQRHHPPDTVLAALERAGLECCSLLGQLPGARFEDPADDDRHIKLVYFARRARRHSERRG